jgi:hypothetical protein
MMAYPLAMLAGMLMLGGAQGQSSMRGYDKFVTPNFQHVQHGNGPDALSGTSPSADREEKQAVQKLLSNDSYSPITLSSIGVGLLSLATMLGVRLRRGLQPATIPASSAGLDLPMNTSPALGDNVMEMKSQDSNVKCAAGVGWGLVHAGPSPAPRTMVLASDPNIKTDVGSSWKPETGGFSSTDTPDFYYEEDDERGDINKKIGFKDGIMGSTGLDKMREQNSNSNPGVAGALDVDPNVIGGYTCATAEAAGVKFELTTIAKMGRFDQEVKIDMPAASDAPRLETIMVKPVCMGFEDFYAGWAPETPPGFSVTPIQGRMERRGGEPSVFDIEVVSDGQTGEKVGYLCIVLPDDDEQFTIKVTVNCF